MIANATIGAKPARIEAQLEVAMRWPHQSALAGVLALLAVFSSAADTKPPAATKPAQANVPPRPSQSKPKLKADAPENVRKLWESRKPRQAELIAELRHEIRNHQKNIADARTLAEAAELRKEIRVKLETIADIQRNDRVCLPCLSYDTARDGFIGHVGNFKIQQVINETTMVISLRLGYDAKDVYLTGVPTKGFVDGQEYGFLRDKHVVILDTRQFKTALGAGRTMYQAKPFNFDDWLE